MVDVIMVLGTIGGAIVGAVSHRQWVRRSPDKLEELAKKLRTKRDSAKVKAQSELDKLDKLDK